ncbi:MAG: transcriptional regulator NrdR [Candidatus Magasanikbacteria bacterium RIFCSPHIGHO2_02_FULL_50_9b]|uniref:Transcriptional repressor NrdR n=1 Tax=Candidatus Magasanikbacteria bacterium RIFCSPHIGHO2_02_FULL_50_9b TaxID=1798682 RepID=A0A1F6M8S2_9BACT|nr:MAG: transcriptional regulator NrdR [Candidatus Magasanikbacteria bacterium RIFCSPHIGHO2_02_FULL_50_9b]
MLCPACKTETKVVDSRVAPDGLTVRRRRECDTCGERFSTIEEMELLDITVVKRDGGREVYDREKMGQGIRLSMQKRPYTNESFRTLISRIERDMQKRRKREIKSSEIGDIVMHHLKNFDKIGYIRFASIYRSFTDVSGFAKELQSLEKKKKK